MVIYGTDSPYEKFLLSGRGASHYDAARELADGTFQPAWIGHARDSLLNSTHYSPLPEVNLTEPPGDSATGRITSSRARRSVK